MGSMTTVLESSPVPGVRSLYRLAVVLAAVSGTFCVIFLAVLAVNYHGYMGSLPRSVSKSKTANGVSMQDPSYRVPAEDSFNRLPTDYQSFLILRQALAQNRQDESIREQIRKLDYNLRLNYFQRRDIATRTTYFLLASSVLFFAAIRTITVLKRRIPDPSETSRQPNGGVSWRFIIVFSWLMLFSGLYAGLLLAPAPDIEQIFLNKLIAEADAPSVPMADGRRQTADSSVLTNVAVQPTVPMADDRQQTADGSVLTNVAVQPTVPQPAMPQPEVPQIITPVITPVITTPAAMPAVPVELTEELLMKNWVSFRNFDGNGVGFSENPPTHWNARTGENILWQSEVPLAGNSSPVIWTDDNGGKLFLSAADEETEKIFCYDIVDGTLLWTADVTRPEAKLPNKVDDDTGYAAPTPVVDGRHVYAMFANGELVAVDFTGNLVWRKSFGNPDNFYGFASSPALHVDRLIVQFDNGDGTDGTSRLVALNLNDGSLIWETLRDMPNSWASPTIKRIGDSYQIITCANPYVVAYNPEDGTEIWRVRCLGGDVGPSAVSLGNLVFIANVDPRNTAIDAAGTGDITATHILWVGANALPATVSPLATEKYYITLDDYGYMSGFDPTVIGTRNRARFWELELGDRVSFYSSPIRVGTLIYTFDKSADNARAFVIDLSKIEVGEDGMLTSESEAAVIIATNPMPEPVVTSPAMLNNRLYIRGKTTLFCIGME